MNRCPKCGEDLLAVTHKGVQQLVCGNEKCNYCITLPQIAAALEPALQLMAEFVVVEFDALLKEVNAELMAIAAE